MRNQRYCALEETCSSCCVSDHEQSFFSGQIIAPVLAGALQPAAGIDFALLKTLQHLHGLPVSVLLNIFQLMADPIGFWHRTPPQEVPLWMRSWVRNDPRCAVVCPRNVWSIYSMLTVDPPFP